MADDVIEKDLLKLKQIDRERDVDEAKKVSTRYSLRTAERADDSPVFLLQERKDSTASLDKSLTDRLVRIQKFDYELPPDDIVWYEQDKHGKLERVRFGLYDADYQREKKIQQTWGEISREPATEQQLLGDLSAGLVNQFTQRQEQELDKQQEQQIDLSKEQLKTKGFTHDP